MRVSSCRGQFHQGARELGIVVKALRAGDQPKIELVLGSAQARDELGGVSLRIVDQVARMDLEERRQEHAGRIGQMRPRPIFDLRKIDWLMARPIPFLSRRTTSCWVSSRRDRGGSSTSRR